MTQQWQTAHIPLAAGMQQREDARVLEAPALAVCKNAQFDEIGGVQKRKPYSDIAGSAPSNIRRIRVIDGELVAFTKDEVYTYSGSTGEWLKVDDYWAVHTEEKLVFDGTANQLQLQRAELDGVVVYTWSNTAVGSSGTSFYAVAVDKATGAVIVGPKYYEDGDNPRLLALKDRIVLAWADNSGVGTQNAYVQMLLPSNINSSTSGEGLSASATVTVISNFPGSEGTLYLDRVGETDTCVFAFDNYSTTNNYTVGSFDGGKSGTPSVSTADISATGYSAYEIAAAPDGRIMVLLLNGSSAGYVDILSAALSRTSTAVAVFATGGIDFMTAAFDTTLSGGEYTAHVFAGYNTLAADATDTTSYVQHNTVDTAGSAGTESKVCANQALYSSAFVYDSDVYFWASFFEENICQNGFSISSQFTSAVQNTLALYRYDGELCAVATQRNGMGRPVEHLHIVQEISDTDFAVLVGSNRTVTSRGYSQVSPVDLRFSFDSNKARRTAQSGRTGYITGGHICQYDGNAVVEVGFHLFPWALDGTMAGSGGALSAGDYTYKATLRWVNARGEVERSTTATYGTITAAASDDLAMTVSPNPMTRKTSDITGRPALEVWRTEVNPAPGADFYLVTDKDPLDSTNPNRYLDSQEGSQMSASFEDDEADTSITAYEANPESSSSLGSVTPPAASIIMATQDRVFLAGLASDPYQVRYSLYRGAGEIASFNEILSVPIPSGSGEITALSYLNETPVVFCERGIYMLPGEGFDNTGAGQNYGPPRLVSSDVGADSAEAVAVTPAGVFFRSSKGWHLLDRGWGVNYIGGAVSDYDSEEVVGVEVLAKQHQVRIVTSGRILVFDTLVKQWSEWSEAGLVGSCIWQGKHIIATSSKIKEQRTDYVGCDYSLDVETAWIKLDGLQGFNRARRVAILGEYRSAHRLRVRAARDFDEVDGDAVWFDDKLWTPSPATTGGPEQVQHRFSRQKCQAIKLRITDADAVADDLPATGEALKLSGFSLEYGVERGIRRLPAAQKQ